MNGNLKKYNDDNRNKIKLNYYYYSTTIITAAAARCINHVVLLGYGLCVVVLQIELQFVLQIELQFVLAKRRRHSHRELQFVVAKGCHHSQY